MLLRNTSQSSSSDDQSLSLSPVQGLSFVNIINNTSVILTKTVVAKNTISLHAAGPSLYGKVFLAKLTQPVMFVPSSLVTSTDVISVAG